MNAGGLGETRERDEETAPGNNPVEAQRPRNSISSFIFISFILFLLTNHNGAELVAQNQYRDALRSYNWQLGNYSAWLNGTESNFTLPETDPLLEPLIYSFVAPGNELNPSTSSYYSNITGYIQCTLNFHNLTTPHSFNSSETPLPAWAPLADSLMKGANMTELVERVSVGGWNLSAPEKLGWNGAEKFAPTSWRFNSSTPREDVAMVHGRMDMTDPNTGAEFRLTFEGVHFLKNGSVYGLAEPGDISPDIRLLPGVVPQPYKNFTAQLVEPEMARRVARLQAQLDSGTTDFSVINDDQSQSRPRCSLTLFMQLKPTSIPRDRMRELEAEMLNPTGITTVKDPGIKIEGVLVSKECGFVWELQDGEGVRSAAWFRMVTTYAGIAALVYLCLLGLLARQMNVSNTPTNLSRLSRWSFLTQALADSIFFAGHITFAVVTEGKPSVSLAAPAFLACLLFVYEAQFAILIFQIQAPEDSAPVPAPAAARQAGESGDASQQSEPGAPSPNVSSAPSLSDRIRSIYSRVTSHPQFKLWFTLAVFIVFVIRISIYPPLALFVLGGMYAGLWIPQIYRSARRGRTSGMNMEYLVGTTILRLAIAYYFLAYKGNILDIEAKEWFWPLAAVLVAEVLVIRLQELFGPAFFLPKRLSNVPTYDYHPPIPLPDPEAPEQSLGDCAICMDAILVDPVNSKRARSSDGKEPGDLDLGGLLNRVSRGASGGRKNYSLAPCHHLFHTECLERWLAIKNICPQCRRPLPPL